MNVNKQKIIDKTDELSKFRIKNYKFPCFLSEKSNEIFSFKEIDFKEYFTFVDNQKENNNNAKEKCN
jgi:hypothetical protein